MMCQWEWNACQKMSLTVGTKTTADPIYHQPPSVRKLLRDVLFNYSQPTAYHWTCPARVHVKSYFAWIQLVCFHGLVWSAWNAQKLELYAMRMTFLKWREGNNYSNNGSERRLAVWNNLKYGSTGYRRIEQPTFVASPPFFTCLLYSMRMALFSNQNKIFNNPCRQLYFWVCSPFYVHTIMRGLMPWWELTISITSNN